MEKPQGVKGDGNCQWQQVLTLREMEFRLLDCLVLGTLNVTAEVDLTELVLKVRLLTVRGHSPLCILGAQK
jgi:hypothetical protein